MASRKAEDIDRATFNSLLKQYLEAIPPKLEDLERFRMHDLPSTLQEHIKAKQDVHLTKDELTKLVEWKLKHGTFRPKLLQLVQSNSDSDIQEATTSAFKAHLSDPDAHANAKALTSLRGIGIATGSLIMSTLDPDTAPFFGDEVFRWLMWDEGGVGNAKVVGSGWDRKIAYNAKEYERFVQLVDALRERLGVPAIEVEQVGYVLGRMRADLAGGSTAEHKRKANAVEESEKKTVPVKKQQKTGKDAPISSKDASGRTTRSGSKKN